MNHYNDQVRSLVKIIHKQQEDISSCSDRLSKVEETREKQKKKTLVKNVVGSMEETSQLLSPLEEWEQVMYSCLFTFTIYCLETNSGIGLLQREIPKSRLSNP